MLQPRIVSREASLTTLATALNNLALCSRHSKSTPNLIFTRHASHAAQGRANGPKDSAGRRLGAKKTASQYVIPGNIIYKQRGTKWFPGENVGIGKDHTIYSLIHGYVRYYRNPALHPKRRYIGVALEKEGQGSTLPTPPNAPTRRRLGMYAAPMKEEQPTSNIATPSSSSSQAVKTISPFDPKFAQRRGGHGLANFEIGRVPELLGVKVKSFDRGDRWTAWRVRARKAKEKMEARAARGSRKTKGKKSAKKVA